MHPAFLNTLRDSLAWLPERDQRSVLLFLDATI